MDAAINWNTQIKKGWKPFFTSVVEVGMHLWRFPNPTYLLKQTLDKLEQIT